jgi:hypothetical protein
MYYLDYYSILFMFEIFWMLGAHSHTLRFCVHAQRAIAWRPWRGVMRSLPPMRSGGAAKPNR